MPQAKLISIFALGLVASGCGGDDGAPGDGSSGSTTSVATSSTTTTGTQPTTTGTEATTTGSGSAGTVASVGSSGGPDPTGGPTPTAPPPLGAQLDRVGRPLVSTVLLERWQVADAAHDAAVDVYNADDDPGGWAEAHWSSIHLALGIFDSLDNASGNTHQYDTAGPSPCANTAPRDCYQTVARLLANDWILVRGNTNQPVEYLGIEEEILEVTTSTNARGGRRPDDDAVDRTYSLLANSDLTDNVGAPASAQVATFPFLAAPD